MIPMLWPSQPLRLWSWLLKRAFSSSSSYEPMTPRGMPSLRDELSETRQISKKLRTSLETSKPTLPFSEPSSMPETTDEDSAHRGQPITGSGDTCGNGVQQRKIQTAGELLAKAQSRIAELNSDLF